MPDGPERPGEEDKVHQEREPFRAYDGEDREGFAEDLADEHPLERNEFERRFPERGCMPEPHRPSECASVQMMEHLRAEATVEVHHEIPRCLLRLRDHAEAHTEIDGVGIQVWLDYECEALRFGVDPDVDRDELAAMIEGSTVALLRDDHREAHAGDFARWGQLGGLKTASRYGTAWMALLARRRWERITAEALTAAFAAINGGRV